MNGRYASDEYTVRDIEGAWSDPFRLNFTLADVPPPQLDAKARTQLSKFTLNNVPASEQLRLYEIWTRYPYSHSLEVAIYNSAGTTRMTPASTVAYYTGTKSGHDIRWNDIVYTIPATLADGNYILRISAIGQNGIRTNKDFPIRVNTPINLVPSLESSLLTRESTDIRASTSKYANNVTVTMFRGSSYQNNQVLTGTQSGDLKNWSKVYAVPAIPDGNYQVRYVATTPNGNSQTVDLTVEVFNNRPPVSGFNWSPATIWEGDAVQIRHAVDDPDNDTLQVRYQVTAPSGHVTHYPSSTGWYNVAPANYSSLAFQLANVLPGQYTIQQTVSDGIAPAVTATKTFIVGELTINGQVKHTEDWDKHRKSYNQKQTGTDDSPRTYDTFWAGEAFILEANTTDTQDSSTVAQWVKVTLLETGDSVYLSSHDGIHWTGELMKEEHIYLPDGNYRFRFEVLYSGPSNTGVTKSDIRTIRISDDVYDFFLLHRIH